MTGDATYSVSSPNQSFALMSIGEKLMENPPPPNNNEVALLIITATVGMIGNLGILIVILVISSLRTASNAFLFHQSALDLVKSAFCLPFAQTMVNDQPPAFCSIMGGSYIVFVTTSAFNLLAIVMSEAYQFADLMMGIKDSRNCCCVIFGIFMIWFTSIIMNLGVAFIPGNPSFDREMGHCIFVYGITRNYVLHMLWIVLITMALALTSIYLRMLYVDIKKSSYYRMTTLVRATVSIDTSVETATQRRLSYQREKHHVKAVLWITRKKLYLLVTLTVFFVLFWYPLFMLTAGDPGFNISPTIYKTVTIVAWCNPTVTPIILFFFIRTICCCKESNQTIRLLREGSVSPCEDEHISENHSGDLDAGKSIKNNKQQRKNEEEDEQGEGKEESEINVMSEENKGARERVECVRFDDQDDNVINLNGQPFQRLDSILNNKLQGESAHSSPSITPVSSQEGAIGGFLPLEGSPVLPPYPSDKTSLTTYSDDAITSTHSVDQSVHLSLSNNEDDMDSGDDFPAPPTCVNEFDLIASQHFTFDFNENFGNGNSQTTEKEDKSQSPWI